MSLHVATPEKMKTGLGEFARKQRLVKPAYSQAAAARYSRCFKKSRIRLPHEKGTRTGFIASTEKSTRNKFHNHLEFAAGVTFTIVKSL